MSRHFETEIDRLKSIILALAARVEENLDLAVKAVEERDYSFAREVIDSDVEIDQSEVEIEEDCLKILALHQPVAVDLRFIVSAIKMNNDLERIGDLAVNIAEHACFLSVQEPISVPFDFPVMADKTQKMLKNSLDSLVNLDTELARKVCLSDDDVDAINRKMYQQVEDEILKSPEHVEILIHLLCISRHLERIADHATNIAEDVIYTTEGEIVRHKAEDFVGKHKTCRHTTD